MLPSPFAKFARIIVYDSSFTVYSNFTAILIPAQEGWGKYSFRLDMSSLYS
jgi:hypothetical protein